MDGVRFARTNPHLRESGVSGKMHGEAASPGRIAVHYSDETMGKILSDVRIFLRELLVEVQGKKEKDDQKKSVLPPSSEICNNNNNQSTPECTFYLIKHFIHHSPL